MDPRAQFPAIPARVVYNYTAQDERQLTLVAGRSVLILQDGGPGGTYSQKSKLNSSNCDSGWSRGTDPLTGQAGFFPSDYVRKELPVMSPAAPIMHPMHPQTLATTQHNVLRTPVTSAQSAPQLQVGVHPPVQASRSTPVTLTAVALYDFTSSKPSEQSIKKGEVVRVISRGAAGGWTKGEKGIFPTDYVKFQEAPLKVSGTPANSSGNVIVSGTPANSSGNVISTSSLPIPQVEGPTSGLAAPMTDLPSPSFFKGSNKVSDGGQDEAASHSSAGLMSDFNESTPRYSGNPSNSNNTVVKIGDAFEFMEGERNQVSSDLIDLLGDTRQQENTKASSMDTRSHAGMHVQASGIVPPSSLIPNTNNVDALLFPDFNVSKQISAAVKTSSFLDDLANSNLIPHSNSMPVLGGLSSTEKLDIFASSTSTSDKIGNREAFSSGRDLNYDIHGVSQQKVFVGSLLSRTKANQHDAQRSRDRPTFSLNDDDEEERVRIWTQPFFNDLFTGALIKRVVSKSNEPILSRLANAFHAVRLAITQVKGLSRRDSEIAEVLSLVSSAFKEARDVCNEIPINAQDHQKFVEFLMRFMSRVKHLRQGELVVSPCVWSATSFVREEDNGEKALVHQYHGVIILVYRTSEGTEEDFSLTVVNTSKDNKGLDYHAMEIDDADGSTLYNLAFELVNIPNVRIQNTAFWLFFYYFTTRIYAS